VGEGFYDFLIGIC